MLIQKFANLNLSTEISFKKLAHCGYCIAFVLMSMHLAMIALSAVQSSAQAFIYNVILFIDTSNNA